MEVSELLHLTKAPPRLQAHLALVHDVAVRPTTEIGAAWPNVVVDQTAVHLGAATHDIGKVVHPQELSEPGHAHELAGRDLLVRWGWPERLGHFAVTHAGNLGANDPIEDLLVAVADKVWKGKREGGLEQALVARLASVSGQDAWQVWLTLDDILTSAAEAGPERLHWQVSHPV